MPSINISDTETEEVVDQSQIESQSVAPVQRTKKPIGRVSNLLAILGVLIFLAVAAGLVKVIQDKNDLKKQVNTLSQVQKTDAGDEAKQLSSEVGKLIELPSDEVPTIATVVDVEKVRGQPFFANAQNGDKVLLYAKTSKAILYRPSAKKIIEVAPINLGDNQTPAGTTTTNQ